MANKNIQEVAGGEQTTPVGTEGMELDDGAASKWIQMLNLVIRKIRETGGPTVLGLGAIPDNAYLKRSGTSLIGGDIRTEFNLPGVGSATQYLGQDGQYHEIPTATSLFANNAAASPAITGYKSLSTTLPTGGGSTTATAIPANDTVVEEFFATNGVFDFVSGQVLHCHVHLAKTAGTKNATAYIKVYSHATGGAETLLGTSEVTANLAGVETEYDFSIPITDTTFLTTDQLGFKIFASPVGGGSNPTVTTYYEGTTAARLEVGASAAVSGGGVVSGPDGFMDNGVITVSVAGNNLTVALKTIAGADPSVGSPVKVRIGNVYRSITAALSVTKNAGTNWCNAGSAELATKEIDYFVYLGYNATDGVTIGFSRIPYARLYSDFSTTSTDEKYAGISTIANAAAGDNYVNVGRFAATLSAGAGYTWTVPTFTNLNLIQRPVYESRRLDFVSTRTPQAGSLASVVVGAEKYKVISHSVQVEINTSFTLNGSNASYISFTLPFTPVNSPAIAGIMTDSGAAVNANATSSANTIFARKYDGTGYTTGANRNFIVTALLDWI